MRRTPIALRPHDAAEPLRLLLTRAESAAHLDEHARLWKIEREVRDLRDDEEVDLAFAELRKKRFALLERSVARDDWSCEAFGKLVELVEILTDHERSLTSVSCNELLDDGDFLGARCRESLPIPRLRRDVHLALEARHRDAHLRHLRRGDPALRLDELPRRVVTLGADEREHLALAAILAYERRREAEPSPGLEVGGHTKHGGRK